MPKSKEEIQRLVNEFLEKPAVPQVTEKEREAQCLAMLDRVCGPGDEHLIGHLAEIASGGVGKDVLKGDRLVTVYPSAMERMTAMRMLRVWHRGLAARSLKVDQTVTHRIKWDPNRLSLSQLESLERVHEIAALPAGETDAEIVPPEDDEENEADS